MSLELDVFTNARDQLVARFVAGRSHGNLHITQPQEWDGDYHVAADCFATFVVVLNGVSMRSAGSRVTADGQVLWTVVAREHDRNGSSSAHAQFEQVAGLAIRKLNAAHHQVAARNARQAAWADAAQDAQWAARQVADLERNLAEAEDELTRAVQRVRRAYVAMVTDDNPDALAHFDTLDVFDQELLVNELEDRPADVDGYMTVARTLGLAPAA